MAFNIFYREGKFLDLKRFSAFRMRHLVPAVRDLRWHLNSAVMKWNPDFGEVFYDSAHNHGLGQYLEMWAKKYRGRVSARTPSNFEYIHPSLPQREPRFSLLRGCIVEQNIVRDPIIQIISDCVLRLETPYFIAHHYFQIMGEPTGSHYVRKSRG